MPFQPHPTWPPRWVLICGLIGMGFYLGSLAFMAYSIIHYVIKYW